jgi:Leucine-rich repeat (LRR) protein
VVPVTRTHISAIRRGLEAIPAVFPDGNHIRVLNLAVNRIRTLPPNCANLTVLILAHNELEQVPLPMLQAILGYAMLEQLDLSYNLLSMCLPDLNKLQHLRGLSLMHNRITGAAALVTNAESIDLSCNHLTVLPRLKKRTMSAYFDGNFIKSFERSPITVTLLSLGYNRLRHVNPQIVFTRIVSLCLAHNELRCLPNLADGAPMLSYLDASCNLLEHFPLIPLRLEICLLAHNSITELPPAISQHKLVELDLSHNLIRTVPNLPRSLVKLNIFANLIARIESMPLPALLALNIEHNRLEEIPIFDAQLLISFSIRLNCVRQFVNPMLSNFLTKLDLSNNSIENLPAELFSHPVLYDLNLSNNLIRAMDFDFSNGHLIRLNLSWNPLEAQPPAYPPTLEFLNVSGCGVEFVAPGAEIFCLDASSNHIFTLPVFPALVTLRASCNRFIEFPQLAPTIQTVDLAMNLIEVLPGTLSFPNLRELDLSFNDISAVSSAFETPQLAFLSLANNPVATFSASQIASIDLSETPLAKQRPAGVSLFVTSEADLFEPSNARTQCHGLSPQLGFAQHKHGDGLFSARRSVGVFGLFFAGGLASLNDRLSARFAELCSEQSEYSASVIENLAKEMEKVMASKCRTQKLPSMFTLGITTEREAIIAFWGGAAVSAFGVNGAVELALRSCPAKCDCLTPMRRLGQRTFYGARSRPVISAFAKMPAKSWVVILPDIILDEVEAFVPPIARNARTAAEFAYRLRNRIVALPFDRPFSVLVIDMKL